MICMDMIYVLSGNNAIKSRLRRIASHTCTFGSLLSFYFTPRRNEKLPKTQRNSWRLCDTFAPLRENIYAKLYHLYHGSFRFRKNDDRKKIGSKNWITIF